MTVRLIKLAAIYLILGMSMGIWMGIAEDHTLRGVHAHMNLLGWATLGISALVFHMFPQLGVTRLATAWFWVYNLALPVGLVSLGFKLYGDMRLEQVQIVSFLAIWLGGILFAANVFINLRQRDVRAMVADARA
jgi:hypothetical protein